MAGLTFAGFERKRLPEIKAEIEDDVRAAFGDDTDIAPQSPWGQFIGVRAQREADLWELFEHLYLSMYRASAEGISLDGASQLVNVTRLGNTKSQVIGSLTGAQATLITAGHIVKTATDQLTLLHNVTIDQANADRVRVQISPTVALNDALSVTIDGTTVAIVAASAVASAVAAQLAAAINAASTHANASVVPNATEVDVFADGSPINVSVSGVAVSGLASQGLFEAVAIGPIDVSVNALNTIVTPATGWDSITNRFAGTKGSTVEGDQDFRQRGRDETRGLGAGSMPAILARLQRDVPNILSKTGYENRKAAVDIYGRPANSFEIVVDGGDKDAIALAIWRAGPAGVETFGNTTVTVTDASGNLQTVKFSRPAPIYVWAKVQIDNFNTEERYPPNGRRLISEALANQGNKLQTGNDVIRQRLLQAVYSVPGIKDATLMLATSASAAGPPGPYAAVNLSISPSQRAVFDPARVTVP